MNSIVSLSVCPIASGLLTSSSLGAAVKQLRKELDQVFSLDELEEVCRTVRNMLLHVFIHTVITTIG